MDGVVVRIYKLILAVMLSFVLAACNNAQQDKEETKSTETSKVKSDSPEATTEQPSSEAQSDKDKKKEAQSKKKIKQTKKSTKAKVTNTSETAVNLKQLTHKTMTDYLNAMPNAFNQRNYSMIRPFIKSNSKAEEYILAKLPTGSFDNYRITAQSIDQIDVRNRYAHAIVTRTLSSNATGGQLKRVITVFDFYYNKQTKKMELYDFNDKVIFDVHDNAPATPKTSSAQPKQPTQQAKGDATTCIQTRLQLSCEGISDTQLRNAYNTMVSAGTLPQAADNGCITCTIKAAYQLKDQPVASQVKVKSLPQAVQMASDKYRKKVEAYYSEMDIAIVGAEPINGKDIQEDLGGKYYKVKAIDIQSKELLQTYKVYIQSGKIIAE